MYGKVSAGTGVTIPDSDYYDEIEYTGYIPEHDLALIVNGESMKQLFQDGEIIFVKKTTYT